MDLLIDLAVCLGSLAGVLISVALVGVEGERNRHP
jgi:hypothetical protein